MDREEEQRKKRNEAVTRCHARLDNIMIRADKETGAAIRAAAAASGKPVQRYIIEAVLDYIRRSADTSAPTP